MSIHDGIETDEHGVAHYQESLQLYRESGKGGDVWVRAEVQLELPAERAPLVAMCRYAALHLHNKGDGYVVYDRVLSRIVDGVYYNEGALMSALEVAQSLNENGPCKWESCNGVALGLIYPTRETLPDWNGTWEPFDWSKQRKEGSEEEPHDPKREWEQINRISREEARKSMERLAAMRAKYMPKSTESEKDV